MEEMKKEYYNGNKQEFWKTDLDYPFILYPMNEQIRHQAEKQLGVTLPESFIDLYSKQNGGDLAYSYFMLPDEGEGWVTSFDPIHFENDDESLFTMTQYAGEEGIQGKIAVLWSDFHHWLALDYRKTTVNPSIIYIVENYEQHDIAWEYLEIAPSFDVFLTMLYRKAIIDPKTLKVTYKKR